VCKFRHRSVPSVENSDARSQFTTEGAGSFQRNKATSRDLCHGIRDGTERNRTDLYEPSRQLDDWRAAISFARSLPDIDAGRIATFGSSSGGGHALTAAAADPKVAAAISQVPMLDRDSQSYNRPPHVVQEMKAARPKVGTCLRLVNPMRRRSSACPEPKSVGVVSLQSARNLDGGTESLPLDR
jgi:hypothetical protein